MTVSEEMVLAGALAVRKRRMELNGIGRDFDPTIPPSEQQLDLTRCALTAALSDQVVVAKGPQDRVDEIMRPYLGLINETPELLSLLYDIDMLPEQTVTVPGAIRLAAFCEVWKRSFRPSPRGEQ